MYTIIPTGDSFSPGIHNDTETRCANEFCEIGNFGIDVKGYYGIRFSIPKDGMENNLLMFYITRSPSRRSTDNAFFVYDDGEVSSDIWIVVDSYGVNPPDLISPTVYGVFFIISIGQVGRGTGVDYDSYGMKRSPDTTTVNDAWQVLSSGDVDGYYSYVYDSYGKI